jgi:hypothetical protein
LDSLSEGFEVHYRGFQVYFLYEVQKSQHDHGTEKGISSAASQMELDRSSKYIAQSRRDYVMYKIDRQRMSEALKDETWDKFYKKWNRYKSEFSIPKACLKGMLQVSLTFTSSLMLITGLFQRNSSLENFVR